MDNEDKMCWETCSNCGKPPKVKDPKPEGYGEFIKRLDFAIGIGKSASEFFRDESQFVADRPMEIQAIVDKFEPTSPLPRKEVISVQPGDVVNIVHSNPKDNVAFHVSNRWSQAIILPIGGCTLEVYREQEKQ